MAKVEVLVKELFDKAEENEGGLRDSLEMIQAKVMLVGC